MTKVDESLSALLKRLSEQCVFQWNMLESNGSVRRVVDFSFDEVVDLEAHSKDMQELRLDLLMSFSSSMKGSGRVIHVSCDNSLSSTLKQSCEDKNALVVDLIASGRLKCVTVSSIFQLYALLDMLELTLNVGDNSNANSFRGGTLLILDNLGLLLRAHRRTSGESESESESALASASAIACAIPTKLHSLVDVQSVLCFQVRDPCAQSLLTSGRPSEPGAGGKPHKQTRLLRYCPRTEVI